ENQILYGPTHPQDGQFASNGRRRPGQRALRPGRPNGDFAITSRSTDGDNYGGAGERD
ncbi:hypothetical protein A2U01_0063545, partial [Trifolium medium]|nr:hypothetical protein [Trifolium medium]